MIHLFIINPAAGSRDRTKMYKKEIRRVCRERDLPFRIEVSQGPGDCFRLARAQAQAGEPCRIYACGGDGTLNEVAAGAAGYANAAVTCYSGGSGNDFVKIFDDPQAFFDLERLMDAQEAVFDLMDCNGDVCLNICSVGLDARIGTDVSNYKRLPLLSGFRAYVVSAVVNVIRGISEHYVVQVNDETVDAQQTMICVCNGRFYGGGFNPVPEAEPDDGVLDVLLVNKVSRLQVPGVVGKYKAGRYKELPHLVRHFRTTEVTIQCDKPTPINLDGEERTGERVHIRLSDKKLTFFYPAGLRYRAADQCCHAAERSDEESRESTGMLR